MNIATIIFLVTGFASVVGAFILEGGHLHALWEPTAAIMVFGGTIGAVGVAFPIEDTKRLGAIFKVIFKPTHVNKVELITFFKDLSYKTRKNGLLSIEAELSGDQIDPFIKKGLQLVVDGVEPATIQSILELDADSMQERHKRGSAMFDSAGGFAPTMGIIGTVMGLVHVLGNLDDASTLGPKTAVAFIATLYGVGTANLLWLPLASQLKVQDEEEYNEKNLIIEAVILIQVGANPNTLAEKLKGFLNKQEIAKFNDIGKRDEI